MVGKDVAKKEIQVSKTRLSTMQNIHFTDANWFDEPILATEAQYRYRGPRMKGYVAGEVFVSSEPLSEIPAPGQSIVFYNSGDLMGGGIIR